MPPRTRTPLNFPLDWAHTQDRSPLLSTGPKNLEATSLQAMVQGLGEDSGCLIQVPVSDYWLLASLSALTDVCQVGQWSMGLLSLKPLLLARVPALTSGLHSDAVPHFTHSWNLVTPENSSMKPFSL